MRRPGPESNPRALAGWALLGLIGLWGWSGCKAPETADPGAIVVATAYGDALTVANLLAEVPPGLTARDSTGWLTVSLPTGSSAAPSSTSPRRSSRDWFDFEREVAKYRAPPTSTPTKTAISATTSTPRPPSPNCRPSWTSNPTSFASPSPSTAPAGWSSLTKPPSPRHPRPAKAAGLQGPRRASSLASRCADAGLPFDLDAERWWTWEEPGSVVDPRKAPRQQPAARHQNRLARRHGRRRPLDQRALLLVTERLASGAVSPAERVADRISELLLHRRRNRAWRTCASKPSSRLGQRRAQQDCPG